MSPTVSTAIEDVSVLPLRILWSGFALDWALYATTLFIAFSLIGVPEWIRRLPRTCRRIRTRRQSSWTSCA